MNPVIAALCLIGLACGAFVSVVGQGNLLTFAYVAASGFVLGGQVAQRHRGESR